MCVEYESNMYSLDPLLKKKFCSIVDTAATLRCLLIASTKFSVFFFFLGGGGPCIWLILILAIFMSQRAIYSN